MKQFVSVIVFCLMSLPLAAQDFMGKLLEQPLFWTLAETILASDYDPLLRSADHPDRGAETVQNLMRQTLGGRIHRQPFNYLSRDTDGDTVTLSACLYLPLNQPVRRLLVANHYTIGANREAPSETLAFEAVFCAKGYAVLMADYLGYGITRNRVHPYLAADLTARHVVDMLLHVRSTPALAPLLTDSLIIAGYSQGAAVTLAALRLLETEYPDIPVLHAYAGGGPYTPAEMYDDWIKNDRAGIPCAIPLAVLGMNEAGQLHLDLSDFFREPLLGNYADWILSKQYSVNAINRFMLSDRVSDAMPPQGMNKEHSSTRLFYNALQQQTVLDISPRTPLWIFHSTDDRWVPFFCADSLRQALERQNTPNVTFDFAPYGNHTNAAIEFFRKVYLTL